MLREVLTCLVTVTPACPREPLWDLLALHSSSAGSQLFCTLHFDGSLFNSSAQTTNLTVPGLQGYKGHEFGQSAATRRDHILMYQPSGAVGPLTLNLDGLHD